MVSGLPDRWTPTGYQVGVQRSSRPETMEFDLVVHGAGRTPELSSLDLDAAGVDWDEHGVHVAGHLQSTTNPAVYAAGDSANTPGMPLTPVAVIEGKVAASNMLKGTTTQDLLRVAPAQRARAAVRQRVDDRDFPARRRALVGRGDTGHAGADNDQVVASGNHTLPPTSASAARSCYTVGAPARPSGVR